MTPVVVLVVGWQISRSLQKQSHVRKLTSEFMLKWTDDLLKECDKFQKEVTNMQHNIHFLKDDGNGKDVAVEGLENGRRELPMYKYEIELISNAVKGSERIVDLVDQVFLAIQKNYKAASEGGYADFDAVKSLQSALYSEMRKAQAQAIELKGPTS